MCGTKFKGKKDTPTKKIKKYCQWSFVFFILISLAFMYNSDNENITKIYISPIS